MSTRSLTDVEDDIKKWIINSTNQFKDPSSSLVEEGEIWVLKFIPSRYLASFLRSKLLAISTTPGFTWGDGVYVTPLRNPYSTMMYGRVGIMGRIAAIDIDRVYDASNDTGIRLYQEWIQYSTFLFRQLTTTIHSNIANRVLRNCFRRQFKINLTTFAPDQFNRAYVDGARDRWYVVSDWSGVGTYAPGQRPMMSQVIRNCEWVAIVQEDFEETPAKTHFSDLLGPHMTPANIIRIPSNRPSITSALTQAYSANRGGVGQVPTVVSVRP
jgi:hypothetical protein